MNQELESLYFMIEGPGKALDLVKQHIAARLASDRACMSLVKKLGLDPKKVMVWRSRTDGVLTGINFQDEPRHPDFKAPGRQGCCYPRKGTVAYELFGKQKEGTSASYLIAKELGVPTFLEYRGGTNKRGGVGSTMIGYPFNECGFLYLSQDGPYAMWIPDVPGYVAKYRKEGWIVNNPARSFTPDFEGCRLIFKEEWEVLVAKKQLDEKIAEQAKKSSKKAGSKRPAKTA